MEKNNSYVSIIETNLLEDQFKSLINNKNSFLAYFHGSYDSNGVSWCSDCDKSRPIIDECAELLKNQDKVKLIKFPFEKNDRPLYSEHPNIKLTRVPSLVFYDSGVEFGRLVEDQLFNKENVKEFFMQTLE